MGHFNILGLSQMLRTVNLSLYEDKFSGDQQRWGVKGARANAPYPPKLLNNLYKKGYVYNRHQLYVLLQHYKGFWCVHHTTIASFTLQHRSKAISNSCHHHKMLYKICPAQRCSQLHIHHANFCSEQVPNSSYLDFWLTGSNLVTFFGRPGLRWQTLVFSWGKRIQ